MINFKTKTIIEKKFQKMFVIESCWAEVTELLLVGAKLIFSEYCTLVLSD